VILLCGEPGETVARLRTTARHVAARIEGAVRQPVVVGEARAQVGVSVGVAVSVGSQLVPERLLLAADRAMYRHKDAKPHRRGR
jgi:GGDEF domain-containing protein